MQLSGYEIRSPLAAIFYTIITSSQAHRCARNWILVKMVKLLKLLKLVDIF